MAMFRDTDDTGGITSALVKGDSYIPGKQGSRIYFSVTSIEYTAQKVDQVGGRVVYPKTSLDSLGSVAEFEDCYCKATASHCIQQFRQRGDNVKRTSSELRRLPGETFTAITP